MVLAWNRCAECGHAAVVVFSPLDSQARGSPEDIFVLLQAQCPRCGEAETALYTWQHYRELLQPAPRHS